MQYLFFYKIEDGFLFNMFREAHLCLAFHDPLSPLPLTKCKLLLVRALQSHNFLKSMKTLCLSNKQEVIGNYKKYMGPRNTNKAYSAR